jgi:chromosome partitioning protein
MTIFAVANQKGGVGKTTTVVNLGAYLGAFGARVLLVDCDPQGNTTSGLGVQPSSRGLYGVLLGDLSADVAIVPTSTRGVDLLPSTAELAGVEVQLHLPRLSPLPECSHHQRVGGSRRSRDPGAV